ncbi:ABC transporter substrate-binding protein [Nesterenkonia flava]|uniref:ABC transporter substrate-binding protein n=1 Tax=Nesterenkonia flava TaxID=469799 RepID=A0ABU1FVX9_9MICC|nr:ABC transporter substrate-binding protein [Nesterenkonia flava]MDR5712828.1 ABC transporter substrate-binding protein [Nesterenkonia flava]
MKKLSTGRALRGTALISLAALALTACGPDTSGTSAEAEGNDTDWSSVEPAESIVFATNHPGGSQDIENELIAEFTEETGIEVEVITSGANYEETSQWFQTGGGSNADVIVLSDATWFPNYLNDALTPVDELLEAAEVDTSRFVTALYDDYLYEDSHYGAPYARSTPLFYYNADQYEELGLEVPTTWEEVAENGRALVEADLTDSGFAFPSADSYVSWTAANLAWAYGGGWSDGWDFSTVSSEGTVEALEFAQDAVGDWATVSSTSPDDDFGAGVTSQAIASTGSLVSILSVADFEVGTAFLPGGPASEGETPTGGAGLMIASASSPEEQLAAAMFIGHMTAPENTARFSQATGYVPVNQDADMSEVYAETPQFETAVDQLERTRSQDNARVFLPGGDLELSQALQRILTSDVDVQEELDALESSLQELYDQELASELD